MYAVADLFLNTRIHNYTWKMERLTRIFFKICTYIMIIIPVKLV